jgi:hypothetical protein
MIKCGTQAGVVFAVLLIAVILLHGCHKDAEQDKIKKVIITVQQSAENKDINAILSRLSKTYRDPQGNDYDGIKGLLLFYFFRHQKVSIFITNLEVTVNESSAKAGFQAVLSGGSKMGSPSDSFPEALGMYIFDVSLAKESGEWKVASAKWERFGDTQREKTP